MGVAPVLPQAVGQAPRVADGVSGQAQRQQPRVEGPALGPQPLPRRLQQAAGLLEALRALAQDARQLGCRPRGAGVADRRRVGQGPAELDGGHHRRGVEHPEGGGDHLAADLTHDRAPAAEVGGPVGQRHPVDQSGAPPEAEGLVAGVALG